MTRRKTPETLRTKGQAREILARMRPAFREHVKPHTRNGEGERLGGGSILNARWNHRLSRDIDVYVNLETTEDGRTVLDRAAAACGGYRIEHRTFRRIEFERNKDNHVDVSFGKPTPAEGEQAAVVDGEPALVLSTAQIMSGKLQGRGMTAPGRDLLDIAACREADREALEIAVNGLPDENIRAILKVYQELEAAYAKETAGLEGVPDGLKPILENPTAYAGNAVQDARYESFEIRTHGGVAEIETATREGARVRTYQNAEQLQSGMERDGVNAFPDRAGAGPAGSAERDSGRAVGGARQRGPANRAGTAHASPSRGPRTDMATGRPHGRDRRANANTGETRGRTATTRALTGTSAGSRRRGAIEVGPAHAGMNALRALNVEAQKPPPRPPGDEPTRPEPPARNILPRTRGNQPGYTRTPHELFRGGFSRGLIEAGASTRAWPAGGASSAGKSPRPH